VQVYNEQIYDVLTSDRSTPLQIRSGAGRTWVDGATEVTVAAQEEVVKVMETGDKNRSTGATLMNTDSSRSHLLFRIKVTGVNKISNQTVAGALTLVDLAGSERVSKTDASGERLVEAAAINKSLTCLGQVFKALSTNSPHVPYRNSKLTHALADSLGGDSKTAVFVNVSPLESNLSETHMTLRFGQNIRKIELGPASKKRAGPPKPKAR
jgi:kinesin family protein C2/C3